MKDEELRKLYTIEAFLDYGDLPKNFREGWSPSFGLHFEEVGIGENEKAHAYISLNGKLKKTKCEFIENKRLALNFRNYIEPKLRKRYPSINLGGVSKSMLALNKSVIKVKESQIKGFKMIFELFRKVATSPKSTPDSMTNSTVVTFNTDGKKLTDHLLATLKCCNKTIPMITRNSSILNPKLFKSSFKTLNRC